MEIIKYSDEHRMFRESVRKYLEKEVAPYAEEWEEAGITPRSAWKKLGDQGFYAWMCRKNMVDSVLIFSIL